MGLGKELSKAVVSAADGLRPDPLGSSGAQIVLQSCPPHSPQNHGKAISVKTFCADGLGGWGWVVVSF